MADALRERRDPGTIPAIIALLALAVGAGWVFFTLLPEAREREEREVVVVQAAPQAPPTTTGVRSPVVTGGPVSGIPAVQLGPSPTIEPPRRVTRSADAPIGLVDEDLVRASEAEGLGEAVQDDVSVVDEVDDRLGADLDRELAAEGIEPLDGDDVGEAPPAPEITVDPPVGDDTSTADGVLSGDRPEGAPEIDLGTAPDIAVSPPPVAWEPAPPAVTPVAWEPAPPPAAPDVVRIEDARVIEIVAEHVVVVNAPRGDVLVVVEGTPDRGDVLVVEGRVRALTVAECARLGVPDDLASSLLDDAIYIDATR